MAKAVWDRPHPIDEDDVDAQYERGKTIRWNELLGEFYRSREEKEKPCTPKHIYDLRGAGTHAAAWFEAQGVQPAGVGKLLAREYLRAYRAQGVCDQSVVHRWQKLKSIFRWAYLEKFFRTDKLMALEKPAIKDTKEFVPVEQEHIQKIVAQIHRDWNPEITPRTRFKSKEGRNFFEVRDIAITYFLADTGMRVSECFGLRRESIDLTERTAFLELTKNGTKRNAYFGVRNAAGPLARWLAIRNTIDCGNDYLFVTERGTKIDPSSWGKQWNKYRVHAGIEHRIRRHDLRHYASTLMDDVDEEVSEQVIGHLHKPTHKGYNHRDDAKKRAVHDQANPVDDIIADAEKAAASPPPVRRRVYTK